MDKIINLKDKKKTGQITIKSKSSNPRLGPEIIAWSGPLYYKHGNGSNALIFSFILVLIGFLFQIFTGNITTTVVISLLAILVFAYSRKNPPIVEFVIGLDEITANNKIYYFDDIESFCIDYYEDLDVSELSLQLKKWYFSYIKLPLQAQDPVKIRNILIMYIPEKEHPDSASEIIGKMLGL
jgi:hypothetical protein